MKGPQQKNTLDQIKKLQMKREQRRVKMEEFKKEKQQRKALNLASGKNVDIDFELMIEKNRYKEKFLHSHTSSANLKLSVCVRKRPIFKKEQQGGQIDAISCANPEIKIHQPKYKVDGITKYIQNHQFTFDNTFNQEQESADIYQYALRPLLPSLLNDGIVTCFAYGQTGSGKTFTMNGIQQSLINQLYGMVNKKYNVCVSFFQIYGGRCLDLLNNKALLNILQDKNNNIQIQGLVQRAAENSKQLFKIMEEGNSNRTTHATVANDTSSRSHSICQVLIKMGQQNIVGKLVLVDLAGSERAQDTQSNNRQRRIQGADINKSLLALKQCIRAMDDKADHVPFRASKLTLVLRDSFINKNNRCKVVMIACISPGSSSADHSLNTLRYADRLKDRGPGQKITQVYDNKQKSQSVQQQSIQKIQSITNIKKQEMKKQQPKKEQTKIMKPPTIHLPNKNNTSNVPSKKEIPAVVQKNEQKKPDINRSYNKKEVVVKSSNKQNAKDSNKDIFKREIPQQIEQQIANPLKNRVKQDMRYMKNTMKNQKKQELFDFHQKVSNILQEQEQIFATHMAAIKEDAKLLTQQSEIISSVQGVGFIDYDIDSYVQKLQTVIKKKLKIYNLLAKKVDTFKKNLRQQQQIRHKIKDTTVYY